MARKKKEKRKWCMSCCHAELIGSTGWSFCNKRQKLFHAAYYCGDFEWKEEKKKG